MSDWREYQEEVADLFRYVGLSATTNGRVEGVRTAHSVDVVVRQKQAGVDILWLVECKHWKKAISKDKVLAFRMIIDDTGSDRGFMIAENGYQSGAFEAASFTNVTLSSIGDLKDTLSDEFRTAKLLSILTRLESCRDRYWAMNKPDRIELNLRPEVFTVGYSGANVIRAVTFTVHQAISRGVPIKYDRNLAALLSVGGRGSALEAQSDDLDIQSMADLCEVLESEVSELEARLDVAEAILRARGNV